jgi:hypothetical protein
MKKFSAEIESINIKGDRTKRVLQADTRNKLNFLLIDHMSDRQLIRCTIKDTESGEVIDQVTQAQVANDMAKSLVEGGFSLDEMARIEDENELMTASATNEELIAVSHIGIKNYKKTSDFKDHAAVFYAYTVLKRRGVHDPVIDSFIKKNNLIKALALFAGKSLGKAAKEKFKNILGIKE